MEAYLDIPVWKRVEPLLTFCFFGFGGRLVLLVVVVPIEVGWGAAAEIRLGFEGATVEEDPTVGYWTITILSTDELEEAAIEFTAV